MSFMSFMRESMDKVTSKVNEMAENVHVPSLDALRADMESSAKHAAWASLDATYVTPRILVMNFPSTPSSRIKR
jgi:hypothetical protein